MLTQSYVKEILYYDKSTGIFSWAITNKHRTGHLVGTTYDKKSKKGQSQITINRQYIYLGLYSTQQEAHKAYLEYKQKGRDL